MKEAIRILIVEDKPSDAELAKYTIQKVMKDCEFQTVETRKDFLNALEVFQPDVILSDYRLPRFDGMKALKLALEHAPLTPLIIWTGSISEDVAVECMKAGANNYVLKENIKRLAPAVIHALEERQLLLERTQAEEKYQNIIENSLEGIFQSTPQGRYLNVNPAMARIYGYDSPKEMIESVKHIADQIYVDPARRKEFIRLLNSENIVENYEERNYRKDGSIIWTSTSARAVRDIQGNVLYYEGFIQDITQRKKVEETLQNNEKRFRALIENGLDDISLLAIDGTLLWESPSIVRNLGYPPDTFVGHNIFELMHPDDQEWTQKLYQKLVQEAGNREQGRFRLRHSDGTWRWVEAIATNMLNEPSVNAIVINYRDITQRKKAEEALRQSQLKYQNLVETSHDLIWSVDTEGKITFLNRAAKEIYGYEPEELIGRPFSEIMDPEHFHPENFERFQENFANTDEFKDVETYVRHRDGKQIILSANSIVMRDEDGNIIGVTGSSHDITERKRVEENLRYSENRYRLVTKATNDVIWEWNPKSNQLLWSENAQYVFGYPPEEIGPEEKWWDDHIHPDDRKRVLPKLDAVIVGNESIWMEEYRFLLKDGSYAYISDRGYIERDENGEHIRMIGAMSDITSRKEAEMERQALLEIMQGLANTTDLRELLELIHHSIAKVIYARNFFVVLYNEQNGLFEEIYSVDQYDPPAPPAKLEKSITSYVFRSGEPLLLTQERFDQLVAQGELELVGTNSASWMGVPLKTSGKTIGVIAVQDYENDNRYTERDKEFLSSIASQIALVINHRQAVGAVQESEIRYRSLFENLVIGFALHEIITDNDGQPVDYRFLEINPAFERLTGIHANQAIGKSVKEILPGIENGHRIQIYGQVALTGIPVHFEEFSEQLGKYYEITAYSPKHGQFAVTFTDITERKQAEHALHQSEALYRQAIEVAGAVPYYESYYDEGKLIKYEFIGEGIRQITGYGPEEFSATLWDSLVEEVNLVEDLAGYSLDDGIQRVRTGENSIWKCEHRLRDRDGNIHWVFEAAVELRDENGNSHGSIGTYQDITARKQAEESEREQRALAEALRDTAESLSSTLAYGEVLDRILAAVGRVVPHDAATIMLIEGESARVVRSYGYDKRGFDLEIMGIQLRLAETNNLRQMLETGQPVVVYDTHSYPGWKRLPATDWLRSSVGAPISIYGEVIGFILLDSQPSGFFTPVHAERLKAFANQAALAIHNARLLQQAQEEIAERKRAEIALMESTAQFHTLFEASPDAILLIDPSNWSVIDCNKAACQMNGYEREELIGQSVDLLNASPTDANERVAYIERVRQHNVLHYETSHRHKTGRVFPVEVSTSLIKFGTRNLILGIDRDITERKRAEEEIRRRVEETSALLETSLALTNLDLNATLQTIGNSAKTLFVADGCRIFLMEPDGKLLRCVLALQENSAAFSELRIKIGDGVTGSVAASGQAEIVNEMQNDPRALEVPGTLEKEEEAIMFAPLKERDRTIGVLSIRHAGRERPFQPADLELLEAFASMAASAVSNARLFEETQRRLAELHASEERFRQLADNIKEAFWMTDAETGKEIYISPAVEAIWERPIESLMYEPNTFIDSIFPEDQSAVLQAIEREKNGEKVEIEYRIIRPNGSVRWVWDRAFPIFDDAGKVKRIAGISADITERRESEIALIKSQSRYRELFDSSPISIWEEDYSLVKKQIDLLLESGITDLREYLSSHPDKLMELASLVRITDANQASLELYHAEKKEVTSKGLTQVLSKDALSHFQEEILGFMSPLKRFVWEGTDKMMNGKQIEVIVNGSIPHGYEEDWSKVIVSISDITERKQAEQALLKRERQLEEAQRLGHIGSWEWDMQTSTMTWSNEMYRLYDRDSQLPPFDLESYVMHIHPDDQERIVQALQQASQTHQPFNFDYRALIANGKIRWMHIRGETILSNTGQLLRLQGIAQDITERRETEQQLRKLSRAVEQSASMIVITDTAGNIEYVNPKFTEVTDYSFEEAVGQNPRILKSGITSPEVYKQLWQTIISGKEWHGELLNKKKNDELFWEYVTISPILNERGEITHFVSVKEDITQRKQSEVETQRHLAELEALYENGLAVGSLLKKNEIGNRMINTFARYLKWHHVTIRLRREESDDLDLVAFNLPGLKDEERAAIEKHFVTLINKVGQGFSGWVIQTGAAFRTGNVHSHPQYIDTHAGIQSGLYMPLKVGERVIGVISVESETPDAFTEQDERLLATLANQAAIAFENARLYETTQRELSERKRAEQALRASEVHYRQLADSITDILFELDQDLHYTHWNKASETLTGVPAKDAIGKPMHEIFGESEEQTRISEIYESVLKNRQPRTFETTLFLKGQKGSFEINAYPSTRGVSVVAKDVTERKRSEIIMQKRFELMEFSAHHSLNELMQKTIDEVSELTGSSIGFLHFVDEDQITLGMQTWSSSALQLFQVPVSEGEHLPLDQAGVWAEAARQRHPLIQNDYESLAKRKGLPPGHVPITRELVIPIIRNERIMAIMGIANKSQDYRQYDLEIAARLADYAWDITERKQMELALEAERNQLAQRVDERTADLSRANSNLARALRVKDEFLANMSHELRTPLNAILGLSESLSEQIAGPLNEKQQKYISTIGESGHHLLSLINDILDLAKIDAGQITLDINKVDVHSVCQASLRMIKQLAQKKNQEVSLEIDDGLGLMWADERRLKQMLVNLLGNAVKFTPENGRLGLEVHGDEEANKISFTVWDEGVGIREEDLARLFQPFVQLDSGLARETTGTGLGLALVAQMARLHGGSIAAFSQPENGSRFTIVLPWEPASAMDAAARMKITGKFHAIKVEEKNKPVILLVEDTREVTMMLKDYLELAGYKIVTAQDGVDAIVQAKLVRPELILMDVQMPRMDGLEATRKLRSEPDFRYTPIIALTALAMSGDRERCLEAGMDEYISKPINLKALIKIIQECLFSTQESKSQ